MENTNTHLNVYIFCDDETATLFNEPVLQVPEDTKELTDEMVREILIECLGHYKENKKYIPLVANWERDKVADAMWDLCTLIMNSAALIHPKHQEYLETYGNKLAESFGNDSSTYRACDAYNGMLKKLSVRVISFPAPDLDDPIHDYTV